MSIKLPKIFLDSGDPLETKKTKALIGFLDGQTTNPSLVAKNPEVQKYLEKGKKMTEKELFSFYRDVIKEIEKQISGPISAEVYADWDTPATVMLEQAKTMASWGRNVYIKFPAIPAGLAAASQFVKEGGRVNMTLVFDQIQAAAVYKATEGARIPAFISPFVGRWDDRGYHGLDLIKNIVKQFHEYDRELHRKKSHVEVLSASVRTLTHLFGSMALGADMITVPLPVLTAWVEAEKWIPDVSYRIETNGLKAIKYEHIPLRQFTDYAITNDKGTLLTEGLSKFINDWKKLLA